MSDNYQKSFTVRALNRFLEETFEIAYGDGAIDKYTMVDTVSKLREFSDLALQQQEALKECLAVMFAYEECVDGEWGSCHDAKTLLKNGDNMISNELYEKIKTFIGPDEFDKILNDKER